MLRPVEAFALVALSLAVLIIVSPFVHEPLGLVAVDMGAILLPTLWVVIARRLDVGFARSSAKTIAGGILLGAGAFYLMALVEEYVLEQFMPMPPALKRSLHDLIVPPRGLRPLAIDLAALALVPAFCEELLFRGAVFSAFGRGPRGGARAVIVVALLFGAYHASPYRFLPALLMGIVLGLVRLRAKSLWPAISFHATNNALVVLALRHGYETPLAPFSLCGGGMAVFAAALACCGWLLSRLEQQAN